jgi:macrolide transport system ATP-binding/permease protein
LSAVDVTKSYAGLVVLDGIALRATAGHRIGAIGENGAGKSTLLRLLAGVERPDTGDIETVGTVGFLSQEPMLTGTVGEVLARALAPLHAAVRDVERLSARIESDPAATDAFARRLEWAQDHDAWDADWRATVTLAALGLSSLAPDRPAAQLSGGQRTRLALAALLTARPDCLLLDEPTNHLDETAMELLEEYLVGAPGAVVAASHDRAFLDRVCTDLFDLDPRAGGTDGHGGRRFGGAFSGYLDHRVAARRQWEPTYAEQQERIAQLRGYATIDTDRIAHDRGPRDNDKFIYAFKGANVERAHARRVHHAERRLATAEREAVPRPPQPLRFTGALTRRPDDPGPAPDAVRVCGLRIPGRVRVDELTVPTGGRLLLTGANGSGKSSLLTVLAGQLVAPAGSVMVSAGRIGLLEQDVVFPEPGLSARAAFGRATGDVERDGSLLVDVGLLGAADTNVPVGRLSVGHRRRLALGVARTRTPVRLLLIMQ